MRIEIDKQKKLAAFWLTRMERDDKSLQGRLKQTYDALHRAGCTITVYYSGEGSLLKHTTDLLLNNRESTSK